MTHPPELVRRGLQLGSKGLSATEVARLIDVPRATVRDWLAGHAPGAVRSRRRSCVLCGEEHDLGDLPASYPYLLGMYLGDGCISEHPRRVFKLRITLDASYPEIADECREAIRAVVPRKSIRRVDRGTWWEVFAYWRCWPCVFPQHGAGRKHERPIRLADWQSRHVHQRPDLLLRGLIQSDGCRFQNTGRGGWSHPRYSFTNASADIRDIFCHACELLGLRWTSAGERTLYVSRKDDVALLDLFVGPKR